MRLSFLCSALLMEKAPFSEQFARLPVGFIWAYVFSSIYRRKRLSTFHTMQNSVPRPPRPDLFVDMSNLAQRFFHRIKVAFSAMFPKIHRKEVGEPDLLAWIWMTRCPWLRVSKLAKNHELGKTNDCEL